MANTKATLIAIIIMAAIGALGVRFWQAAGMPTEEEVSSPAELEENLKSNLIVIDSPKHDEYVSSPLIISGEARGYWFFEASAPVTLTNWDGLIIAEGYVTTQGDWMTEEFVPFSGSLNFVKPEYGERGFLILKKDNPSGLPEHDDSIEIPIFFK